MPTLDDLFSAPESQMRSLDDVFSVPERTPEQRDAGYLANRIEHFRRSGPTGENANLEDYLPFAQSAMEVGRNLDYSGAVERIDAGNGSNRDFDTVARHIVTQEQDKNSGWLDQLQEGVLKLPAFMVEMVATRGAGTAASALGRRAVAGSIGRAGLRTTAGQVATRGAGYATGLLGWSAANPQRTAATAAEMAAPTVGFGEDGRLTVQRHGTLAENAPMAFVDTMIEIGSEQAGRAIGMGGRALARTDLAGPTIRAAGERWAQSTIGRLASQGAGPGVLRSFVQNAGYDGIAGELFEERLAEVLRGTVGLRDNYGTTGNVLTGNWQRAARDLSLEFATFAAIPLAQGAAHQALRSRGLSSEAADRQIAQVQTVLQEARNEGQTPAQAMEALAEVTPNAPQELRQYGETILGQFPEHIEAQGPEPGLEAMPGFMRTSQGTTVSSNLSEPPVETLPPSRVTPPTQPVRVDAPITPEQADARLAVERARIGVEGRNARTGTTQPEMAPRASEAPPAAPQPEVGQTPTEAAPSARTGQPEPISAPITEQRTVAPPSNQPLTGEVSPAEVAAWNKRVNPSRAHFGDREISSEWQRRIAESDLTPHEQRLMESLMSGASTHVMENSGQFVHPKGKKSYSGKPMSDTTLAAHMQKALEKIKRKSNEGLEQIDTVEDIRTEFLIADAEIALKQAEALRENVDQAELSNVGEKGGWRKEVHGETLLAERRAGIDLEMEKQDELESTLVERIKKATEITEQEMEAYRAELERADRRNLVNPEITRRDVGRALAKSLASKKTQGVKRETGSGSRVAESPQERPSAEARPERPAEPAGQQKIEAERIADEELRDRQGAEALLAIEDFAAAHRDFDALEKLSGPEASLSHEPRPTTPVRGTAEGKTGPFEIIATQNRLFDNVNYIERKLPGGGPALAKAMLHPEAIVTKKLAAGDPLINLEENAHIFSVRNNFPDPALMPAPVREGLRSFWDSKAPMNKRTILEGFAQWMVKRSTGELNNLTPEQQAADVFAEKWLAQKNFTETANRIRDLYSKAPASAAGQAAGLLSATAKPAEAELTSGERVKDWWTRAKEWLEDHLDTDLGVLRRMQEDAKAKGFEARLGEDALTVYDRLMFADKTTAGEFESEGVWTLRDGKKTKIGRALGKPGQKDSILETLTEADLAPFQGDLSKFDVYATARHVLDEAVRGREAVPESQRVIYEQAMNEFMQDRAFVQRAEEAANRLTDAFNTTLEALASPEVHFLTPEQAAGLIEARPTYVPLTKVIESLDSGGATRGTVTNAGFLKARGQSGEQIVSPIVSYSKRLRITAALQNEQIRRNAVAQYLLSQGMGDWGLAFEQKVSPEGMVRVKELAERLGIADSDVSAVLKEMGPDAASYFTTTPWPTDGTKPTWTWRGPDGKPTNFRIQERALYDLITGQQGDTNSFVSLIRGVANFGFNTPMGRVLPFQKIKNIVSKGATTLGFGFQVRNMMLTRDAYEFAKNTIDMATVKNLPEFYKRAFAYEIALAKGETNADPIFDLYKKSRGDENRLLAFDKEAPENVYNRLREKKGVAGKVISGAGELLRKYVDITGAGENAPRALELRTFLEKHGWTEARLKSGEEPPWHLVQAAMVAASEVTVPFQRQGIIVRELNKIHPFFGAGVAGLSKHVRNWKNNPKGAAIALAGLLSLRLLHWLMFRDEEWYREQTEHDRFNNMVVPIPGLGLRRLPGARGPSEVAIGGAMTTMLDMATRNNPDVPGLVAQSIGAVSPPLPLTPPGAVSAQLLRNRDWAGNPIVPTREENMPWQHNLREHQAPYIASQLTGGRGEVSMRGLGLIPFSEVRNATRSTQEYYERLRTLQAERSLAQRNLQTFPGEREYQRLHGIEQRMSALARQLRGDRLVGGRSVPGTPPSAERRRQIQAEMNRLARSVRN